MEIQELMKALKFDKYYQVGCLFSFFILFASLTLEIKILTNLIVALYSLSFFLFFFSIWMSMVKDAGIGYSYGNPFQWSKVKFNGKVIIGRVSRWLSSIIFILALFQTITFFYPNFLTLN